MKKTLYTIAGSAFLTILGLGSVHAQDGPPQFASVEIFTCSYNDRQGPDDLDDVVDRWNSWMDSNETGSYLAVTFTPHLVTAEQDFDFLWLGRSPSFEAAGAGQDFWRQNGGDLQADFEEVAECNVHVNVASMNVKPPPAGGPTPKPVLSIANCKVHEGRRMDDVVAAAAEWGAHRAENGSSAGTFMWFPMFGAGEIDFDFNIVNVYESHAAMGKETQWFLDNQQWNNRRQQFAGLVQCDVARVYEGTVRRNPNPDS